MRGVGGRQLKARGGRIGAPVRRTQTLHAAALLIDQNGRMAAESVPNFGGQPRDLLGRVDIAAKEDHAPGRGVAQERALVGLEREAL